MAATKRAVHVGKPLYVQYIRPGSTENSAFSLKKLALREVASHTVELYAKHSPENLIYAEIKQLREIISLMRKIHASFSYSKYKKTYRELKEELSAKCLKFAEKYPDKYDELSDVHAVICCDFRFALRCKVGGVVSKVKSLIKMLLAKIK